MTSRKHSSSSDTVPPVRREVVLGVDTHGEVHVAAVISMLGKILGTESFPATAAGYRQLLVWARKRGGAPICFVNPARVGSWGLAMVFGNVPRSGMFPADRVPDGQPGGRQGWTGRAGARA